MPRFKAALWSTLRLVGAHFQRSCDVKSVDSYATVIAMANSSQNLKLLKAFGDKVRTIRLAKGISQEALAELADLDRTYISGVERGIRNISLVNISAIAKALKVKVSELTEDI